MRIAIKLKSVYGNDLAYPANHPAECLARIAGQKTLTRNTLWNALSMGATICVLDRLGNALMEFGENTANDDGKIRQFNLLTSN